MSLEKLSAWENLKFLLKEFQFAISLKILRSKYTVYYAPIPLMS